MDRPQVGDQLHKHESPSRLASGLTHSARLQDALSGLFAGGEDAQFQYDQAVEGLNREPEPMMVAIAAAYGHCSPSDYPQRRALVIAASRITHESALPFLASVALSEVPPEAAKDPHSFSTVAEETIIRTSAVDAIARYASAGLQKAINLLLRCAESPAFSIRRAAVNGLVASPEGQRLRPRLEALIPKEQHFIFNLKQVSVRDAIQVKDPTRHLSKNYEPFNGQKPRIRGSEPKSDSPKAR